MDALEQLTTQIIPALIEKIKEQKQKLTELEQAAIDRDAAIMKLYEALKTQKQKLTELEPRLRLRNPSGALAKRRAMMLRRRPKHTSRFLTP